jgi:hypothetical protein
MVTTQTERQKLIAQVLLVTFFLPYVIAALTFKQGEIIYRAAQVLHTGALAAFAFMLARQGGLKLSVVARMFALFLVINLLGNIATSVIQVRPESNNVVLAQTVLLFVAIFLSFDILARIYTWEQVCQAIAPPALFLILLSAVHMVLFAERVWGRATFFGLHPNLGGEMIFSAVVFVAYMRPAVLRWVAYVLALYVLLQLQSRAALIAVAILAIGCEVPRTQKAMVTGSIAAIVAVVLVCVAMLVSSNVAQMATDFIENDVLRKNDPYRGDGTGLVGRADTWIMAYDRLAERPLFGTGINQSGMTDMNIGIHNGYVKNMAEFGAPGVLVNLLIVWGVATAFLADWRRGVVMLSCAVLFFFNARNVSLNIFPIVLWLAILPWRQPARGSVSARVAPEPAPRPGAQPDIPGAAIRSRGRF